MKKKLFAALSAAVMLCGLLTAPAAAETKKTVCFKTNNGSDYGIAVKITCDVSEIQNIGIYPVASETSDSTPTIQITKYSPEKNRILAEISSLYHVSSYDVYCGETAVLPTEQITDQVYQITVSQPSTELSNSDTLKKHYQNIINSIAVDSNMTYLGELYLVTQCDNYDLSSIYVYAPVSAETEALLSSDSRFAISAFETELARKTNPNVYVLKTTSTDILTIQYSDYLEFKNELESSNSSISKIDFGISHIANYCSDCQIGLEIYLPELLLGDVTTDGEVGVEDAQLTLKAYTNRIAGNDMNLTAEQIKAADINGDSVISVDDAQCILQYYTENTVAGNPITWDEILKKAE